MPVKKSRRKFGWEVSKFSERTRPKKLIGTWNFAVGDSDGFCFFVESESHIRNYKSTAKIKPYRGAIIETKSEAIRLAKIEAAKLQKEWDAKNPDCLPASFMKHLSF